MWRQVERKTFFPLDELKGGGPVLDVPSGAPFLNVSAVHKVQVWLDCGSR